MDTALLATGLASAAFIINHLSLSTAPLCDRLGEKGFQGLYALPALLTLGALIAAYSQASHRLYRWPPAPGLRHLPLLIMPLALTLIVGGGLASNPSATGMTRALDRPEPAQGVLRRTSRE